MGKHDGITSIDDNDVIINRDNARQALHYL